MQNQPPLTPPETSVVSSADRGFESHVSADSIDPFGASFFMSFQGETQGISAALYVTPNCILIGKLHKSN